VDPQDLCDYFYTAGALSPARNSLSPPYFPLKLLRLLIFLDRSDKSHSAKLASFGDYPDQMELPGRVADLKNCVNKHFSLFPQDAFMTTFAVIF
jgi:hypothetical protein